MQQRPVAGERDQRLDKGLGDMGAARGGRDDAETGEIAAQEIGLT